MTTSSTNDDPENPDLPDLKTSEVARIMRLHRSTLARYRSDKVGPPCYQLPGGQWRYPVAGLRRYTAEQERRRGGDGNPPPLLRWKDLGDSVTCRTWARTSGAYMPNGSTRPTTTTPPTTNPTTTTRQEHDHGNTPPAP